jgi:hypothetical protein
MAATGHFYKNWNDVGAPSLTPTNGSLIAVLDWALDVGIATYWEKVFSGTNKAVYRSKTGMRPYLRVDDNVGGETAILAMYETMSDIDTGTGRCPDGITQSINLRAGKCDDAENNSHAYHIVGDAEFFIIAINNDESYPLDGNSETFYRPFYFGEIASYLSVDNYCCIIGGAQKATDEADYNDISGDLFNLANAMGGATADSTTYGDPGYNPHACFLRNASGTIASSGAQPWTFLDSPVFRPDVVDNPVFMLPVHLQCADGSTSGSSMGFWNPGNDNAVTRARLPYVYKGSWRPGDAYGGPKSGDIITIGSSQYVVMVSNGTSTAPGWGTKSWLFRITDDEPDRP